MSINIIYTSDYNKSVVPVEKLHLLESYCKHVYEDEELKLTESWDFSKIEDKVVQWGGYYYVSKNETLSEAIAATQGKGKNWTFYYNRIENAQHDTLWDYQTIYKGKIKKKGKVAFDTLRREIASCLFDPETNSYVAKVKQFWGDPIIFPTGSDPSSALTFYYEEETNTSYEVYCKYGLEYEYDYNIQEFQSRDSIMAIFPWEQHTYYHSFEPMLP